MIEAYLGESVRLSLHDSAKARMHEILQEG